MRRAMNSLARRLAAAVVVLAFCAGLAQASITLTTIPESPIPNGQTAAVAARVESSKTIARVYLQYRFKDARDIAADPDTPWSAWHDQVMFPGEGSEWAGYLPILPAGEVNWCVCAEYTDGSSEGKAEATDALSYDYVHDMRASAELAGSCSTPTNGEDVVVADWGWRQDPDEPGGTNFFANAPGGGQWLASGVGWAAHQNKKFRVPELGATFLYAGTGLSYPVLFFFNLDPSQNPSQNPQIRTPRLRGGVKTFSFNARNVTGTTSKLKVQKSYADGDPGDGDWVDVWEYALSTSASNYAFTNDLNDAAVTYVRILRSGMNTANTSPTVGVIGIDDICVIPPDPVTQTTEVAGTLDYGRLHDMKGITGIVSSAGAALCDDTYGWVQDKAASLGRNSSTNFYAAAPNGTRWDASGVGWAGSGSRSLRLPSIGSLTLPVGNGLAYPVLFFLNLDSEFMPYIRTPRLDGGLGTFSFEVRNTSGKTSRLLVQKAYTDRTPGEGDWFDVEEYELTEENANYGFTNIVNDSAVTYVRILRTEKYTENDSTTVGVIGIDNICATPPTPDVDLYDGRRDPWNMNATNATVVRCLVSNLLERTPAVNRKVTAHYALTTGKGVSVELSKFISVSMAYAGETNGCSLYEGTIPAQGVAGWLHYYFRCDFEGYYYVSPEANGMATPKYYGGSGSTTESPTSAAATHLTGEVRVSRTRYSEVVLMRFVDGVRQEDRQMTLVDDDRWQVQVPVEAGTVVTAYFVGSGGYGDEGSGARWFYGDANQDEPYETPTGGTPERQFASTNSLPGLVIENKSDGYLVYRFDDSDIDANLRYTIRRGVFQDFDSWQEEGLYYVESLFGTGVGEQKADFEDWTEPYAWLPISDMREDFARVSPTNGDYQVYGDRIPDPGDFNGSNVKTPEGWYLSGFRLTNARVADTNQVYTYGGCSNVLAQVMSGGSFFNSDESLSQGVDEVVARMRSSVIDGAKALYAGDDPDNPVVYSHSSSTPLSISTSFSVPPADRADTHYYTSLVFDYRDELNFHELRFTRGDSPSGKSNDRRLRMELVEVRNGLERKTVHSTVYDNNAVNDGTTHKFIAAISMNGGSLTVKLSGLAGLPSGWSSITLNNCDPAATSGQVGFGAYECAPKINYIVISGGTGGTPYSAGSDKEYPTAASTRFAAGRWKWFLGGSDYTASANGSATKWYFDSGENYVLRRRIPTMKVTTKIGSDPFELEADEPLSVASLEYREFRETVHSWDRLYVQFDVSGESGGNCVVFDSGAAKPWRGGTRKPDLHEYRDSYEWTSQLSQNILASAANDSGNFRDSWLVFEGWVVTNAPASDYVSRTAVRFQRSQANPALAQALYSPLMTNGIGTVKFNYHVTGASGDTIAYAVEYTTKIQEGDFEDGLSYFTGATYTNTIASGAVWDAGYRSCNICTNYLYGSNGKIIPMRFRIRVLDEGTSPDAVLWIDNAYANDYPEEKETMWKVYNGRLASADTPAEYERVYGRAGRTLYLNNSNYADTGEARGIGNPFSDWKPYIQAPFMADGIGEVAFHYRTHTATNASVSAGRLTIAISADKTSPEEDWLVLTNIAVTGTGYIKIDDESIYEKTNHYIRFYSETNGVGRVCIDNILVMQPSRPGYDISTVILTPDQPIDSSGTSVEVTARIGHLTQNPQNIRLFASWVEGTNNWGYSNWWSPALEDAANTVELFPSATNTQVYCSPAGGRGLPSSPPNGTIQYVVWGLHDKIPETYNINDVIFQSEGSFVNPPWYGGMNLNDTMTNASAKATFSPYYLIYSCPPGSVWINEVWNNYNTATRKPYPDGSTPYEFVELCGKAGTDLTGWKLNIYLKGRSEEDESIDLGVASYQLGEGAKLKGSYNGWGFFVIGDEGTPNVDYELAGMLGNKIDAFKGTTIAFELMRSGGESGILEHACYVGSASADPQNPNAEFAQRISIPTKSSTRAGYSYSLLNNPTDDDNPAYTNKVAGVGWYWALGYPTPGTVNQNMNEVIDQGFSDVYKNYFLLSSMIAGGVGHGTQNGSEDIFLDETIEEGGSTQIVYVASSFYRIISLTSNDIPVNEAAGKKTYIFTVDNMETNVINDVEFGPKPGWSEDMIAWFNKNNWGEEAIDAGDGDDYSVEEEYLMDTDPTVYTDVDARTTAISVNEGAGGATNVAMEFLLTRVNRRAGGDEVVTSPLRGSVNVYGMSVPGGDETKISKASLGTGAFSGTEEEETAFSLTGDSAGLKFFKWRIE